MAGYRPKSLEELNSLYDKSLNIKNEIDKKASDLEVKQDVYTRVAAPVAEADTVQEVASEDVVTEEISGFVDDFIKNFGTPEPVKKVRPVAPATVKAVSSAKSDEVKAPVRQSLPVQTAPDKPRLIRNSERNDLFEDYKKVMDDEDDDDFGFRRKGRKRAKKLFEKKTAVQSEIKENSLPDDASIDVADALSSAAEETVIEDDIPETLENIDAVIEKVLGVPAEKAEEEIQEEIPEAVYEISEEEEETAEAQEPEYEDETIFAKEEESSQQEETFESDVVEDENEDYEEAEAEPEYEDEESYADEEVADIAEPEVKKSYAGKNLLLCLLLLVLVLATAVSAIKAFAGINSDIPAFEKYHLYSADTKYIQGGIKKGDLVVVMHEAVEEGSIFAYKQGDGRYSFAKLDGVLNEDTLIADNDGQKSIVFRNTVRGTIYKTIPVIGTFAAIIASNYLYIIGGLLLLAVILVLVLVFAFKGKKEKASYKSENQDIVYETDSEETQYDDVEGDFRYLIQEDAEEEYDSYRDEYENQEAVPDYETEDYKYEPDEYVNN